MYSRAMATCKGVLQTFFSAVESRDLEAIKRCFSEHARYSNVPYDPSVGRQAIGELFRPIVTRSERIEWQIVSSAYTLRRAHVKRLNCFWIDGRRYAVPCHGVALVDTARGVITEFRDYVDLGRWRATLGDVLTR
jgi:limonene-1,2-epoxide hydrolase